MSGDIVFATVVDMRDAFVKLMNTQARDAKLSVDFSGVGRVDSSALSLWLCGLRAAKNQNIQLFPLSIPADLRSIAELVGLEMTAH
ncbi:STAS domain-containing protein [Nitrincola nitratireducens]|uniref:Putative NTP binding protein (Contains STAS domain) n=1 Tax=Nitrincola nitratireducens TaxID=1229521 RepID=W9UZP8_9GAMM|nr:STAS domain-containing protein [Nitrincola nitratireducens]EXJ12728.1 putative NTP binding protein (contains STAS domain) [Nitrincola nitratireducens]